MRMSEWAVITLTWRGLFIPCGKKINVHYLSTNQNFSISWLKFMKLCYETCKSLTRNSTVQYGIDFLCVNMVLRRSEKSKLLVNLSVLGFKFYMLLISETWAQGRKYLISQIWQSCLYPYLVPYYPSHFLTSPKLKLKFK